MSTPEMTTRADPVQPIGRRERQATRNLTIVEAMREALAHEMRLDDRVFLLGEDIQIGGAFNMTLGLLEEFGADRVVNTPISETGFMGLATGAAIAGLRPVVDFQYGDFLFLAADQLIQQAAKLRYMSNGQVSVPLVILLPIGASGRGAQHANSMEGFLFGVPGLKIVTPATPYDAKGLLVSALRDGNVVVVCVHKHLYGAKGRPLEHGATSTGIVPEGEYAVPLGVADIKRAGRDVTLVANHVMLHRSLSVAERLESDGIGIEVIDPRTLVPLDVDTVVASARKTRRLLVVEENHGRGGWGPYLIAQVVERLGSAEALAAVRRLALPDAPIPFSPPLEAHVVPSEASIEALVRVMVAS
jgi:pyruvate/2-oxoglutarate/acetoin dehydrogenase E1 component